MSTWCSVMWPKGMMGWPNAVWVRAWTGHKLILPYIDIRMWGLRWCWPAKGKKGSRDYPHPSDQLTINASREKRVKTIFGCLSFSSFFGDTFSYNLFILFFSILFIHFLLFSSFQFILVYGSDFELYIIIFYEYYKPNLIRFYLSYIKSYSIGKKRGWQLLGEKVFGEIGRQWHCELLTELRGRPLTHNTHT